MSIVVQCPHCETKFNLQQEMVGRAMRCPNLDCRQTFTVKDPGRPTEPAREVPPAAPPPAAKPKPRPPAPAKPAVVEAEVVEAAVVAPPKVKEVVWSEGKDVPPPKGKGKKPVRAAEVDDDSPPARRKKEKNRRPWLLIGMSMAVVLVLGFGVFYVLRYQGKAEAALAEQAKKEYDDSSFAAAAKTYGELAEKYPESDKAAEYKFFADLAGLQQVVRQLASGDNPEAMVERLKSFIQANKDSPLAQHTSGYGRDIHEAGRKLGEDMVAHAGARVAKFRSDRVKNAEELNLAVKSIATGRELIPLLDPFRGDERPLNTIRDGLDDVEKQVKRENARTEALAKAAVQLKKVTDAMIQSVETELGVAGFLDDADAQSLLASAKATLREMVKFEVMAADPRPAPASATASVVFVTPVGPTRRPPPGTVGDTTPPSVFLCVARGVLYAIDEETGTLLWATRVGPEVTEPPTVTRAELATGPTDLALVTSNTGGEPALAAVVVKTGETRWYQPLPAPAAGPAVVVRGRVYVALRDPEGSVYEFEVATGVRKGRIRLGQPAGPGMVVRPGTGLLYVAADARRVFVIDAGAKDLGGAPLPPRCVQVIGTRHDAGTLRTPPVLIGPEGDGPGDRSMILAQTDGKLRAFVLHPFNPPEEGVVPTESPATPTAELPFDGWVWFPPTCDGEWLALVTDRGSFRVFGVNQPGNFDKALFPVQSPTLPTPATGTAVRGLVMQAEESAYWVLANGSLQKFRIANVPARTHEVVEAGTATALGEPTQPPQLNNRRDAACLVVRSQTSAGYKAVLMNLATGEIRWQRQLGVIAASSPIPQEGVVVLAAEDGGLVSIPGSGATAVGRITVAPPAWVIGVPPENSSGSTRVAVSADGKTAFTVTPVVVREDDKPVAKYMVRRIVGGRVVHEGTVAAPGAIAGSPVILGDVLLIPASDGFVHRHVAGTNRINPDSLTAGPPWASSLRATDAECSITPISDTTFLTGDGGKQLKSWSWPKTGSYSQGAGKWDMSDRAVGPGLVLPPVTPGDSPRLLIADVTGTVRLYAADRGGEHLRQWLPGGGHPPGKPTSQLVAQTNASGRSLVVFTVENRAILCLDPDTDALKWAVQVGDSIDATLVGSPQPAGEGKWFVTNLGGEVSLVDAEGKVQSRLSASFPGVVPARAAGSLGESILASFSDGSAVVLTRTPAPKKE